VPAGLRHVLAALVTTALLPPTIPLHAQSVAEWDATLARGTPREIDFTTDQGTWMSLDISPDGRWIVFDLLGHIYRVPAEGGDAESLTQNSGIAVNYHPTYAQDRHHQCGALHRLGTGHRLDRGRQARRPGRVGSKPARGHPAVVGGQPGPGRRQPVRREDAAADVADRA